MRGELEKVKMEVIAYFGFLPQELEERVGDEGDADGADIGAGLLVDCVLKFHYNEKTSLIQTRINGGQQFH